MSTVILNGLVEPNGNCEPIFNKRFGDGYGCRFINGKQYGNGFRFGTVFDGSGMGSGVKRLVMVSPLIERFKCQH